MVTDQDKVKKIKLKDIKPLQNGNGYPREHFDSENLDTRFQTKDASNTDIKSLETELQQSIDGEVRFDKGSRALYATDGSNYRQIPIGVVLPKSEKDIATIIALCQKYHAPLLSRGGGTSLAGQCCNVAVVMDMSKYYNRILDINKEKKLVSVEPGIVLDTMRHTT
ncbi:MAG: FAD-binding oxidoreductase, partial [Bacteroidota bacterium]|nr:FAD-binding oxidoreductase [Bacteroidota bacterium]